MNNIPATMSAPIENITAAAVEKDQITHASPTSESTTADTRDVSLVSEDHDSNLDSSPGAKQDVDVNEQTQVRQFFHYQGTLGSQGSPEVTSRHPLQNLLWTE
jgi:hypothetical protein